MPPSSSPTGSAKDGSPSTSVPATGWHTRSPGRYASLDCCTCTRMRGPQRGLRLVPTFFAMSISSRRPYSGTASSISEGPSQLGGSGTALARHAASAAVVDQYFLHVEAKLHHVP